MDFLKRHIEKLILGVILAGLLATTLLLMGSLQGARKASAELRTVSESAGSGGTAVERITDPGSDIWTILSDPSATQLALGADDLTSETPPDGSLLEPMPYILCLNPQCGHLLPYRIETNCPVCDSEQPPLPDSGDDLDGDGIGDFFERQMAFLSEEVFADGQYDYDGDGFLNVEEYKAETKLDDWTDYPPLAANLRIVRMFQKPLPLMLRGVSTNNTDDKSRWDLRFYTFDTGRRRSKMAVLGEDDLAGFEILDVIMIAPAGSDENADPVGTVKVRHTATGDEYTLTEETPAPFREWYARLIFLESRAAAHLRQMRQVEVEVGEEFPVQHRRSNVMIKYKVDAIDNAARTVRVAEVQPAEEGADLRSFDVKPVEMVAYALNPNLPEAARPKDFYNFDPRGMSAAGAGGMMPGMDEDGEEMMRRQVMPRGSMRPGSGSSMRGSMAPGSGGSRGTGSGSGRMRMGPGSRMR